IDALDPGSGVESVLVGGGSDAQAADPPGFVFAISPLALALDLSGLDVDRAGTIYFAQARRRVLALDSDGTLRVVAGSIASGNSTGTPAQDAVLANIGTVSVEHSGATPTAVWLGGDHVNGNSGPVRVALADGTITTFNGSGSACDAAPLSGCGAVALGVVVDGSGGAYFAGDSGDADGLFHVDAVGIVRQLQTFAGLRSRPQTLAFVAPNRVLLADPNAPGLAVVVDNGFGDASSAVTVAAPLPFSHGTDRTLPVELAAASDDTIFVYDGAALWSVQATGGAVHMVVDGDHLGPCAGVGVTGLAASRAGDTLWLAQQEADRVCQVDVASGAVTSPLHEVSKPRALAARSDIVVALSDQSTGTAVEFVPLDGSDVVEKLPPDSVDPPVDLAVASDDTTQILLASGARTVIRPVQDIDGRDASSFGSVDGIAALAADASLCFTKDTHALIDIDEDGTVVSTLAGGLASTGLTDGAAASAVFEGDAGRVLALADGSVALAFASSLRLLVGGQVSTLLGSDQFAEDGDFASARLLEPRGLSCVGEVCLVVQPG
ncbi:MAG TPA: hypothetical protein VGO62_20645, partial [Myxococcota bacterium]